MRNLALVVFSLLLLAMPAFGTVFINEVLFNPPGSSSDDLREYVELMGTPGMKLDGYAFTIISGGQRKYYVLNSVDCSTLPATPEFDEFFSLDGLRLGANGILVLGIGSAGAYPNLLTPDTNFVQWTTLWQSNPSDPHGKIQNDGSNTFLLIRNRPGSTQAHGDIANVLWGKDRALPDSELITPVDTDVCANSPIDGTPCQTSADCFGGDCVPGQADQYGDGNLDKGGPSGLASPCDQLSDLKGASTVGDITDDLEVVDEVSYEHDHGWEHDFDERHVDVGSTNIGLPYRHVHALDDMQGFNADAMTRVDYRTRGPGWPPVAGATGEMANGNNWQDTATEQWIRGETASTGLTCPAPNSTSPPFFYDNCPNADVNSIQPYFTNVPKWLNDAAGVEYNFAAGNTYELMAGRVNPLAIPYIPGDTDRDGDADPADIAKIAAVFGNDDWIFSNSFAAAPETDGGDPATQTRPWDVDQNGDNGIECSDLQWVLNFQGNTDGRIVGSRYDSPTPSATGVVMNSGAGVTVTITATGANGCGRPLNALLIGDTFTITVAAQLTAGANNLAGEQNGVMQYAHDVAISSAGVVQYQSVQPLGVFNTTRPSLQAPQGVSGGLGVKLVNGYSINPAQGVTSAASMYRLTFKTIAPGSVNIGIAAATEPKFAASTPRGVKIGHTRTTSPVSIGDPGSTVYPEAIAVTVGAGQIGDINGDAAISTADIAPFVGVLLGTNLDPNQIQRSDLNCDGQRNGLDIAVLVDAILP